MANKKVTRTYHGWIIVEPGGTDMQDYVFAEWSETVPASGGGGKGAVRRYYGGGDYPWRGNSGCAQACEWWENRLGKHAQLEPTMRGCFRVYTTE